VTHPYFSKTRNPRVLAHRGLITAAGEDSGVWENSAGAFAAAHAAGVEYIETDCQVTASGDVVSSTMTTSHDSPPTPGRSAR